MISRLTGTIAEIGSDHAVIDVAGVGYMVHLSAKAASVFGGEGNQVTVLTELVVREDQWTLYGFASPAERDSYRALTAVQGVGGKVALAILSALTPDELAGAVANGDKAMIGRANGVGPKLAMRIANELAGKLGLSAVGAGLAPTPKTSAAQDALSALANLGFKPAEASQAVAKAAEELGTDVTLDALVRLALKKAAK